MLRNPFVVAVAASAGTLVIMGGTTILVSGITISVAKKVVHRHKMATAIPCSICTGSGIADCDICGGRSILKSRKPIPLKQLGRRRPKSPPPLETNELQQQEDKEVYYILCPACGTTKKQRCLNCLGEGKV